MQSVHFTSNKPYLFKAVFDWLLDNEATPHILVDVTMPQVDVPQEHVKDGQIVLNINPSAVNDWYVDNEAVSFRARFSGVPRQIYVPMNAVLAIYAQENGQGMAFPAADEEEQISSTENTVTEVDAGLSAAPEVISEVELEITESTNKKTEKKKSGEKNRSHLKLIK